MNDARVRSATEFPPPASKITVVRLRIALLTAWETPLRRDVLLERPLPENVLRVPQHATVLPRGSFLFIQLDPPTPLHDGTNDGMTEPERRGFYVEADPRRPGGHRIRRGSQQGEEGYGLYIWSLSATAGGAPLGERRRLCTLLSGHTCSPRVFLGGWFVLREQILLSIFCSSRRLRSLCRVFWVSGLRNQLGQTALSSRNVAMVVRYAANRRLGYSISLFGQPLY